MIWKVTVFGLGAVFLVTTFAGVKEDFVDVMSKSCGKTKEDAEKFATPGRSGNVIKWQMCKAGTVDIEGCNMQCVDSSSKIGN
jgi:hypothetical protein